ncbi:helix-turn-helix domain-containing protein [Tundrisphaera lichenicola]|uniref:helix-turn-helix domain-containing protein n=1 Tax=Tundrisphaera lichenicola TaxID=2029860 RepID=UPI003EBEE405
MPSRPRKTLDHLSPERRAKVEAMMARNRTPEVREREIHDRQALAEEFRKTGDIATAGEPVSVESLVQIRRFIASLKAYREQAGVSLATLAERSGIDQPALSRFENGHGNPTLATLSRYMESLGVMPRFEFSEVPGAREAS